MMPFSVQVIQNVYRCSHFPANCCNAFIPYPSRFQCNLYELPEYGNVDFSLNGPPLYRISASFSLQLNGPILTSAL